MKPTTNDVFVYGTLKRGESRERCWPRRPIVIEWASMRGELRDLRDYPALTDGAGTVLGELWRFADEDIAAVLDVLDEIEGFEQGGENLYNREVAICRTLAGDDRPAYVYRFADPDAAAAFPAVAANDDGFCEWTARGRLPGN